MLVKKLLIGNKLLEEIESSFNGRIQVFETLGTRKIVAGGLIQSGGVLTNIWDKTFSNLKSQISNLKTVLILGLGGGTAAGLVGRLWPEVKIVGVEIDPVMIHLGEKYFGLSNLSQLEIIKADALEYIKSKKFKKDKFDLILVDLYQGEKIVKQTESQAFLMDLKKGLKSKGRIVFNRLFYNHHREEAQEFVKKLERHFSQVKLIRAWSNLLVVVD